MSLSKLVEAAVFAMACPRCAAAVTASIGQLRAAGGLSCPACSARHFVPPEELEQMAARAAEAARNLR